MYDDKLLSIFKFKIDKKHSSLGESKITFVDRIINYAKKYNLNPPRFGGGRGSIASWKHLFNLKCSTAISKVFAAGCWLSVGAHQSREKM